MPGVEIERGADADEHGIEPVGVSGHPPFLLGGGEPDPHDVGAGGVDLVDDGGVLIGGQRPERWRVHSHDVEAGVPLDEAVAQQLGGALLAAVEVEAVPVLRGAFTQRQHQVGAITPLHPAEPDPVRRPDHGHAVGDHHAGAVVDVEEFGIGLGLHDAVHARHRDIAADVVANPPLDLVRGEFGRRGRDANAEDVDAERPERRLGSDGGRGRSVCCRGRGRVRGGVRGGGGGIRHGPSVSTTPTLQPIGRLHWGRRGSGDVGGGAVSCCDVGSAWRPSADPPPTRGPGGGRARVGSAPRH